MVSASAVRLQSSGKQGSGPHRSATQGASDRRERRELAWWCGGASRSNADRCLRPRRRAVGWSESRRPRRSGRPRVAGSGDRDAWVVNRPLRRSSSTASRCLASSARNTSSTSGRSGSGGGVPMAVTTIRRIRRPGIAQHQSPPGDFRPAGRYRSRNFRNFGSPSQMRAEERQREVVRATGRAVDEPSLDEAPDEKVESRDLR